MVIIDLFLTIMVMGGARFAVRAYTERARTDGAQRNTLIVGAGEAGSAIVRELKQNSSPELQPGGTRRRRCQQEGRQDSWGQGSGKHRRAA